MRANSFLGIIATLLVVSGCASTRVKSVEPASVQKVRDFNVTVSSDGRPINDLSKQLVHDVVVPPRVLASLSRHRNSLDMIFTGKPEIDQRRDVVGVRIVSSPSAQDPIGSLGWRQNDVLTAVGTTHVKSIQDIGMLISLLERQKRGMVTLLRQGEPHKILYSVR